MEESQITIRPEDVPSRYIVCFNEQCSLRQQCTRWLAGQAVSTRSTYGPCVYPTTCKGDQCPMYRQLRIIRLAWGFRPLFSDVWHEDYADIRFEVIHYFRSESDFWRYNRGYYKLTPEQQEAILDIFHRYEYSITNRNFQHYEEKIDFS